MAFWAWSMAEPKMSPTDHLEWVMELAKEHFGEAVPAEIYVQPLTAETMTPEGFELVTRPEVGRFGYWFPTGEGKAVVGNEQ